jgi:hypothetical protein
MQESRVYLKKSASGTLVESMAALNQNEREAFEAFVMAIAQATTKER